MAGYNRVVLVGNLTRDPEYKQLPSGQSVCRLGLATNRQFKNRQTGSMIQEVCYVDIDVWGAQAESCNQYLQKGRPILVEGRLKFDTWEDQNGQTRSKHSIVADRVVFLSSATDTAEGEATIPATATSQTKDESKVSAKPAPESKLEKELFDQIETIKKRNEQKKAESAQKVEDKQTAQTGEIEFKDQPPFEDELSF